MKVYIRRAIWEYYFLSAANQGLRKNGLNFAVSLLHIYFFIEKKRKNERNVFPIPGTISHFKLNFEFFSTAGALVVITV